MAHEKFHFTGIDGNDYTLPKKISAGAFRKVRKAANEMDMFFDLIEEIASPEAQNALDAMDLSEFASVLKDWMQGATAPNSPSSSN